MKTVLCDHYDEVVDSGCWLPLGHEGEHQIIRDHRAELEARKPKVWAHRDWHPMFWNWGVIVRATKHGARFEVQIGPVDFRAGWGSA